MKLAIFRLMAVWQAMTTECPNQRGVSNADAVMEAITGEAEAERTGENPTLSEEST